MATHAVTVGCLIILLTYTGMAHAQASNTTDTDAGPEDDYEQPTVPVSPGISFNGTSAVTLSNATRTPYNSSYTANGTFTETSMAAMIKTKALDAVLGGTSATVNAVGQSATAVPTTAQTFSGASSQDALNVGSQLEPPDQGLCVSGDWVYELVNGAVAIYDSKTGVQHSLVSLNTFFGPPPGTSSFYFDPRCVYDDNSGAVVFITDATMPNAGQMGAFLLLFAVKPTINDPLAGNAGVISIPTDRADYPVTCRDATGTAVPCPVNAQCKATTNFHCWGDYPTLAVDNALVWVTVNVFKTNDGPFVGSIIFAFDKAALLDPAANTVTFLFLDPSALGGNFIQPAITQYDSDYPTAADNLDVMYFLNMATAGGKPAVCAFAVHNGAARLAMNLGAAVIAAQCQAVDIVPVSTDASSPGGTDLGPTDSRMQQTPFMRGTLWGAFETELTVGGGKQIGIFYFKTSDITFANNALTFTITKFGYLGQTAEDVTVPSICPFPQEPNTAVIAVSVSGANFPLTHGYSIVHTDNGAGGASTIHLVSTSGTLTNDGGDRLGDYSAAAVAPDSSIWIAGMSSLPMPISNGRENWNTWITQVKLGGAPPIAKCNSPITLMATAGGCTVMETEAELIGLINANSLSAGSPLKLSLQPAPDQPAMTSYSLTAGRTYTFALVAANSAGKDTCEAFVTVMPVAPPTVTCKPFITLPAKASCAAQIATADLITAINGGTTPGNGGAVTPVIQPASPSGTYNLPVGTYDFTLAVTNCAGTGTCTSIVTVTDQEALQASQISCGALPADGVVETPLLTKNKGTAVATYSPAYTKANGCPITLITDNLSCGNCLVRSTKQQAGFLDHCDSTISSKGVNILPEQLGRVAWTVTVEDQAGHEATTDCAVCADHGDKAVTTLGHCPKPFTAATPCDFGNL